MAMVVSWGLRAVMELRRAVSWGLRAVMELRRAVSWGLSAAMEDLEPTMEDLEPKRERRRAVMEYHEMGSRRIMMEYHEMLNGIFVLELPRAGRHGWYHHEMERLRAVSWGPRSVSWGLRAVMELHRAVSWGPRSVSWGLSAAMEIIRAVMERLRAEDWYFQPVEYMRFRADSSWSIPTLLEYMRFRAEKKKAEAERQAEMCSGFIEMWNEIFEEEKAEALHGAEMWNEIFAEMWNEIFEEEKAEAERPGGHVVTRGLRRTKSFEFVKPALMEDRQYFNYYKWKKPVDEAGIPDADISSSMEQSAVSAAAA